MASTIVGLAQDYVGANNINLLLPAGCFGTRLQGGKDAASPRYIFTSLSDLTRKIFRKEDDALLTYLNEDGQSIEPEWWVAVHNSTLGIEQLMTRFLFQVLTYIAYGSCQRS